ncbi:metallophosphoesterase family protein [Celeribacter halophilus]|uniref:metallophosphoesterase family protein n=1 Tax=Celeribacter halophilus TaxID=576117 RepID=UPI003A90CF01
MIKILHTADIHLDSPLRSLALRDAELRETVMAASRKAFSRLVDVALSEQVSALLIAGDLFDGRERSARTGAYLTGELDRLRTAGIKVFYIKGNHDAENPITGSLDLPDNVHVFDARGGKVQLTDEVWVHGVSFAQKHAPDSLLPRFQPPVAGAVNIAMLHSSLAGAEGHDVYAPCHVADLCAMGFDYWALGHIHKRQVHSEAPWVVMPGIPQGRDIGEAGPKSASLLTIERGGITVAEVPTSVVEFQHSTLDISGAEDDDALRRMLRAHLSELRQSISAPTGVVRLTLTGQSKRYWQILRDRDVWTEQLGDMMRAAGDLWLDKLVLDIAPHETAATSAAETTGAVGELSATMQAISTEPGFTSIAQEEVSAVLQDLPPALRARLMPDEAARDALTQELAQGGVHRVLALMKGVENT